jgi:hypothetical protein
MKRNRKSLKMFKTMQDKDLITFYRTEYFKEWNLAWKNGLNLTANDIRIRLGLK